ncbi:hypothetical protein DFH09DRAFT_1128474 [Mycena vulgaris]|nr:hypothetical protein DFH09DRAFT_1128474 [Mycena vulgaris]
MARPAFAFLVLALTIAHLPPVTAIPALVTLPAFGDPSTTFTAVELGVDSELGYTTYGVQGAFSEDGPTLSLTTIPFTATVVAGSNHIALTASATGVDIGYEEGDECDLQSRSAVCVEYGVAHTVPLSSLVPWVIDVVSTAAPSPTSNGSNSSRRPAIYGVLVSIALVVCSLL